MKTLLTVLAGLVIFAFCSALGGLAWFEFAPPERTCAVCHEIRGAKEGWSRGGHTNVNCKACHGGTLSSVAGFTDNLRRAWRHVTATDRSALRRDMPLDEGQVDRMSAACGKCHQTEYASWQRSGHASPVAKFLLDERHNAAWKPADQCLRCHGMFLDGDCDSILARVTAEGRFARVQTAGEFPRMWYFRRAEQGRRAAVPCLACHRGHPMRGGD
ncbi:MAG: multiheme c-type cytochrome, partial [Kiritimatiellia bacterium]